MLNILALGLKRCLRKMTEEKKNSVEKEDASKKVLDKKEDKKIERKVVKKDFAIARGLGLSISPKQCVYVCRFISGKSPDVAVSRLADVINGKRAVPMAGLEVGHKKGKGLAGGKFPKKACEGVMNIVKQASANAVVSGIENPVIFIAKSDRASAPLRKGGRKAKRCNIYIEVRSKSGEGNK